MNNNAQRYVLEHHERRQPGVFLTFIIRNDHGGTTAEADLISAGLGGVMPLAMNHTYGLLLTTGTTRHL